LAAPAQAALIRIEFTGFDWNYDGTDIEDDGDDASAGTADFDRVDSVDFYSDGVLVGSLNTTSGDQLFANMGITGVVGIPVVPSISAAGGSTDFFELFFETPSSPIPADTEYLLLFPLGPVQIFHSGSGVMSISAALPTLAHAELPFGLTLDPTSQVELAFIGFLSNVTDDGEFLTGFDAVGPGEIQGESIAPEPAALALLGIAGLFVAGRRRR
jgi:hypothetical protein